MVQRKPGKKRTRPKRTRPKRTRPKRTRRQGGIFGLFGGQAYTSTAKIKKKKRNPSARTRQRMLIHMRNAVILILLVSIACAIVFLGIRSVLKLKSGSSTDDSELIVITSDEDVAGIQDVPAFPGSVFMYKEDIGEDVVQRFLSSGSSAYILPDGTEWEDVVSFYADTLPELGWTSVLSVPSGDEDRRPGEYWVYNVYIFDPASGEATEEIDPLRSYGLRIYSKFNSVWYEKLTVEEARSGLAGEVAEEKEIELLLAMGSMDELPETFPWALSYPEMWDVDIREASLVKAPLAEFSIPDTEGTVLVEPVAFDVGRALSAEGESFLEEVNSRRSENDIFDVTGTEDVQVANLPSLRYSLSSKSSKGVMVLVVHPGNGIVYAITSFTGEEAVLNYIVDNLKLEH